MKKIYLIFIFYFLTTPLSSQDDFRSYVMHEIFPKTIRVQEFYWQGRKYWLKRTSSDKISWGTKWGRQLGSMFIPVNFLKITPFQQDNILSFEKERLQECEKLKAQCPRVIDFDKNWMVLSDGGISCEKYLKDLKEDQRLNFIQKLILLIFGNQQKGFFHGRCFIRDMLISPEGKITFFDIEEDPIKVMNASEARAREIFFFLSSIYARLNDSQRQELAKWLNEVLEQDVKASLLTLKKYHKIFIFLDYFKNYLGKDGRRFLRTSLFLIENLTLGKS